jgi:hypothetical protein
MIGYTVPEIRRLLISLVQRYVPDPRYVWSWSRWRRRHQHRARTATTADMKPRLCPAIDGIYECQW